MAKAIKQLEPDPTPEEIIARAAEVREKWSTQDYIRNCVHKSPRVEIRSYAFDGRTNCFSEMTHDA